MSDYFGCRVRDDGSYEVFITTNGIDRIPLPRTVFPTPRAAITYASMRQDGVQPLRSADEVATFPEVVIPPRRQSEAAHPASG